MNEARRVKLTIHYDGGAFYGWQVQPDVRTVQGELDASLSRLVDRPMRTTAAGRTDRGVHATGQVTSAVVPAKWSPAALRKSLNAILPDDVWVAAAEEVPRSFHARYDAIARRYVYRIGTEDRCRSPFLDRWCWPLAEPLDRDLLNRAADGITGDRSFRSFAKSGQPERGDRCRVERACWTEWSRGGVAFHVTANRFLHHMVRYLVGTMVDVAIGRRPLDDIPALLDGDPELTTSPPAPPEGLYLANVYYTAHELERETISDEDFP